MKLSEMRQILTSNAIQLTKSLGQNFLHDGNQLRRIVGAADLHPTDQVLEIGPGLGPLTELLLESAGSVMAIEKDQRLHQFLQTRFLEHKKLTLLHDDALKYIQDQPRDWSAWKLVANLPYSVASPILVDLAQSQGCPQRMVATLQLEVAQRIVAQAGDDDYGLLSLLLQLHYEPAEMFKIPALCFYPPPDVDSACITLVRRPQPLLTPELALKFAHLVKLSFSQRRKMMHKLLKQQWPAESLTAAFATAGISPQARAEAVTLAQFVTLTQTLCSATA
jgi:16S rRNA (adenine1518-N6/adenine1519-N6)-dimethyltransferase